MSTLEITSEALAKSIEIQSLFKGIKTSQISVMTLGPVTYITMLAEITPKAAKRLLETNIRNRKLTIKNVSFLAKQMKAGDWQFTGESVKFNTNLDLSDKQHTLSAIVASKTTQIMPITFNLKPEVFQVLDTGKIRNLSDVLSIQKITNPSRKSPIASTVLLLKRNQKGSINRGGSRAEKITNADGLEFVVEYDKVLNEAIDATNLVAKNFRAITKGVLDSMYFLFQEKDKKDARKFYEMLASNTCPCPHIAEMKMLAINKKIEGVQFFKDEAMAVMINAWNLFRKDTATNKVEWKKGKDTFPIIF